MASEFIGLAVLVTLKDAAQTKIHGTIVNIIEKDLVLANVTFLNNGYQIPTYTVQGSMVGDLDVVPSEPQPQQPPPPAVPPQPQVIPPPPPPQQPSIQQSILPPTTQTYQQQPSHALLPQQQQQQNQQQQAQAIAPPAQQFVDPAILSFTRKPTAPQAQPGPVIPPPAPPKPQVQPQYHQPPQHIPRHVNEGQALRSHASVPIMRHGVSRPLQVPAHHNAVVAVPKHSVVNAHHAKLQAPFQELSLGTEVAVVESSAFEETEDDALTALPVQQPTYTAKRSRRGGKNRNDNNNHHHHQQQQQQNQNQDYVMVQAPSPSNAASQGYSTPSRGNGGRYGKKASRSAHFGNGDEEGWATEDVNDIRETEFDFQGNLDRFDKKTVFSQIKAEDTTAEESRLVSFNRLPQRPTSMDKVVRKNYRNTENVLVSYSSGQPLSDRDAWERTPALGAEHSSESDSFERGRDEGINSGRSSRRALSRSVGRKPTTKQGSTPIGSLIGQGATSSGGGPSSGGHVESKFKGTIRIANTTRPGQAISPLDAERNRVCPIVSPLQMLDVERIAETEMGLEEILMTENAARGIATVAIQAFGTRLTSTNHNPLPVVLVFAGNNKSGARAIAAGRHLKNHHVRVMVCVVGLDREDELLENVRRQLNIFRNAGGRVARLEELATSLKAIDSPPELIIDGILGIHIAFDDLRTDDQATAFELISFANKSHALILAIDIPSGIDGHTGEIAQIEETGTSHVRAKWVVALGAPKTGLLNALDSGVGAGWKLFVADIGIPSAAWRKYGSRRRHGVEFGADWVVPLDHLPGH